MKNEKKLWVLLVQVKPSKGSKLEIEGGYIKCLCPCLKKNKVKKEIITSLSSLHLKLVSIDEIEEFGVYKKRNKLNNSFLAMVKRAWENDRVEFGKLHVW